jgi:CheY-like chemotaxis protein
MKRVLTGSGYEVDVAASAREARALDPARYDVLLVDADLGDELGTVLIEELRAREPGVVQRCLLVTGGQAGQAPAGVGFLGKPFRPADLLSAIEAMRLPPRDGRSTAGNGAGSTAAAAASAEPLGCGQVLPPSTVQLLATIRGLRAAERSAVADFLHEGPAQELTAIALNVEILSRLVPDSLGPQVESLRRQVDAVAQPIRRLLDDAGPGTRAGATLDAEVRRRTAWLPFSPVTVHHLGDQPAAGPDTAMTADLVELALYALAPHTPPAGADIGVQPGEQALDLLLTITPSSGAVVRAENAASVETALAGLATALGGTSQVTLGPPSAAGPGQADEGVFPAEFTAILRTPWVPDQRSSTGAPC